MIKHKLAEKMGISKVSERNMSKSQLLYLNNLFSSEPLGQKIRQQSTANVLQDNKEFTEKEREEIKWIMVNDPKFNKFINTTFNRFKLTRETILSAEKTCKRGKQKQKFKPFLYQQFIREYIDPETPYRGILLFHGLGSGKTCTSIISSLRYTMSKKGPEVIVMTPASLRINFINELMNCGGFKTIEEINKHYHFVSYNSSTVLDQMDQVSLNGKLIIVDEVHNLISEIVSEGGKLGKGILKRLLKAKNARFIFLSGTPIINTPYELGVMFNILRPGSFEGNINNFNEKFVEVVTKKKEIKKKLKSGRISVREKREIVGMNMKNKKEFGKRIQGLVSYYSGADKRSDVFPRTKEHRVMITMSKYQYNVYKTARMREIKNRVKDTFRVFSRQFSNFVFPPELLKTRTPARLTKRHLTKELGIYSPKMKKILDNVKKSEGPVLVYSNFKTVEGIEIFSKILQYNNISFIKWTGGMGDVLRQEILKTFNSIENKNGEKIKCFLATSAGAEGISLLNVRQIHIMEPHWNNVRIRQVMGRAVRICSHFALPVDDQKVDIFNYLSVYNKRGKIEPITTDERLEEIATEKDKLNDQFLNELKIGAFDCEMNISNNPDVKKCRGEAVTKRISRFFGFN